MGFKDHFSHASADYRRFRPSYPAALFEWLAEVAPGRRAAWDCATGSGQAAVGLADRFEAVWATDASTAQVSKAESGSGIRYLVAAAESAPLADASMDLVTVAQAYHWFEHDRFLAEVRRVLRPAGVLALWTYGLMRLGPDLDPRLEVFYRQEVGPFWPPERRWVESGYAELPFLEDELAAPAFAMETRWSFDELLGYLGTWSALRESRRRGLDPLPELAAELEAVWGGEPERRVRWPLRLRVGCWHP